MMKLSLIIMTLFIAGCATFPKTDDPTLNTRARMSDVPSSMLFVSDCPVGHGMLNGRRFVSQSVNNGQPFSYILYICCRPRNETDLQIGEQVYGFFDQVTEEFPEIVIDSIILEITKLPWSEAQYYSLPKNLFRDITQPGSDLALICDESDKRLVACFGGGDAAGGYDVNWVIDLKAKQATRIIRGCEGRGQVDQPWQALIKTEKPTVNLSKDPINSRQ